MDHDDDDLKSDIEA